MERHVLQLLIRAADDLYSDEVKAHLKQGVRNLVLVEPKDPIEMIRVQRVFGLEERERNALRHTL